MEMTWTIEKISLPVLVKEANKRNKWGHKICVYKCHCGDIFEALEKSVKRKETRTCGCIKNKWKIGKGKINGQSGSLMYNRYMSMIHRCHSEKSKVFKDYGGRGIYVCDRWRESYSNFIEDLGEPPFKGAEIDRIDNDGPYSPENCRWADRKTQANNKRNTYKISYMGFVKSKSQWCRILEMSHYKLNKIISKNEIIPKRKRYVDNGELEVME